MQKAHSNINWENYPSDETPVNEQNLNKMDKSIDAIDDRVLNLDTIKFDKTEAQNLVKSITYNRLNGMFTIEYYNGSVSRIDTMLENIITNFDYDPETQRLVFTLDDGTVKYADLSALITEYEFLDSATISFFVDESGKVSAKVKGASIKEEHLQPNYLADIKVEAAKAQSSQQSAATSAVESNNSAKLAQSYAVGTNGSIRENDAEDNAKKYKEQAQAAYENLKKSNVTSVNGQRGDVRVTPEDIGALSTAGGAMNGTLKAFGGISLNGSTLEFESEPPYILGVESFSSGGNVKWKNMKYVKVGTAINAEKLDGFKANYFEKFNPSYNGDKLNMTFSQLKEKIAINDFSDLHLYDYIDFTTTNGELVRAEIMGFNTMIYLGDIPIIKPHVLMQTRDCLESKHRYNAENTNAGGFNSSELKTHLETVLTTFPLDLRNAVLECRRLESTKGSWKWYGRKLFLPTEVEVFGNIAWSEPGYGSGGSKQWEGYQRSYKHVIKGLGKGKADSGSREHWWLSSVSAFNTTDFCGVNSAGSANYSVSSRAIGVAPAFLIG